MFKIILYFFKALLRMVPYKLHRRRNRIVPLPFEEVYEDMSIGYRASYSPSRNPTALLKTIPITPKKTKKKKKQTSKSSKPRTYFPETWLWKLNLLGFVFVKKKSLQI